MKICILGEFNEILDEGMRLSSYHIFKELQKNHQIIPLDLKKVISKSFWRYLKEFNPEIVYYIHGSSLKSVILLKIISLYCRGAKTIISMMRPNFSIISKYLISFIKPDLTLVQSDEMERTFKALKCKTEFLPISGVDTEKFNPKLREKKEELRQKYGINRDKFVILHVGSIKKGRNVLLLKKLQEKSDDNQVLIVGAVSTGIRKEVLHQLEKAGCIVWKKYFKDVEEIYALSDCYVFPVLSKKDILGRNAADCIEMPLSVLEAISCNLPVISTKFGALPRVFEEGDGLIFVDKEEEFIDTLEKIKNADINIRTREKVLPYSWENVVRRLEKIYEELKY